MSEIIPAPAETYKLNQLASVLGRYAVPELDQTSLGQINEMFETVVDDILKHDVPAVPHTDPVLLEQAAVFDEKLLHQVCKGPAAYYLSPRQQSLAKGILTCHKEFCVTNYQKGDWQLLVSPESIAGAYGLSDLWSSAEANIKLEIQHWGKGTRHPITPIELYKKVGLVETRQLLDLMWDKVIQMSPPVDVRTYLTDKIKNYHVFWSPLASRLDYATPRSYDRATQLSYDLPHNAAHLSHLDTLDSSSGSARYDDAMAFRSYFEAVAVLSEHNVISVAKTNVDFGEALTGIFQITEPSDVNSLTEWIANDRRYEFKLRAARYAADILIVDGAGYDETVSAIQEMCGIPRGDAELEVKKYLPWSGLGAVYTHGYRKLLDRGITSVKDAIVAPDGQPITTWAQ